MKTEFRKFMKVIADLSSQVIVVASVMMTILSLYIAQKHLQAETMLQGIDVDRRHTSGATFYANKKHVSVGQPLSQQDLIEHLNAIKYTQSPANTPGTFSQSASNTIRINARLPEFQSGTIVLKSNRVASISIEAGETTAQAVDELAIEPEPLGSFILSINGQTRDKMFVRRYPVEAGVIEKSQLYYCLLASEDTLFPLHNGNRFDRILRNSVYEAAYRLRIVAEPPGGGSGLTAQAVKNAISLDKTHGLSRKVEEVFLASTLERTRSKSQILMLYANHVFLGGLKGAPNVYGFLAAAEEYFGKTKLEDLTLAESATLVAMLPQPNIFLARVKQGDYELLAKARNVVLGRVREVWPGKYSDSEFEEAKRTDIGFISHDYREQPLDPISKPFVEYATKQESLFNTKDLSPSEYSGLHVYTSVDADLMRAAQNVLSTRIPQIERAFPPDGAGGNDHLLGAIVALNPSSGEIITMVGGGGGEHGQELGAIAINALAAPASTIKPVWTSEALKDGLIEGRRFTAASLIPPLMAGMGNRVRSNLARSDERLAHFAVAAIGRDRDINYYERLTGNKVNAKGDAVDIGFGDGMEISPLRAVRVYSTFANEGREPGVTPINSVYLDGKAAEIQQQDDTPKVDPGVAFITAQLMRSVLGYGLDGQRGTGRFAFARTGLSHSDFDIGGKTGSGPGELWMMSISPKIVVAVLLTYQFHSRMKNAEAAFAKDTAAIIWSDYVRAVRKFRPDLLAGHFVRPTTVVELTIDPKSGCQTRKAGAIPEFFLTGSEPPQCQQ